MKKPDLIKQLANRINQPHVVEKWINKIEKAAYNKGYKDSETKKYNIPVVGWRSELLPEFDVQEINEILQDCKEKQEDLAALICRVWNKGYMTAVNDEREG